MNMVTRALLFLGLVCIAPICLAQDEAGSSAEPSAEELAQKLSNPVASLISVPLQFNYDQNIGLEDDGSKFLLNIQPVIPFSISEDWNVISRTILPIAAQDEIFPGAGSQTGLGDTFQSLFFSPKAPTASGLIWGVGPIITMPTATDDLLGRKKWAAGPTIVMLKMSKGFTFGFLGSHSWSFAGSENYPDINSTFFQPFLSYVTPKAWTFSINAETSYDWEAEEWGIPVNLTANKMVKLGKKQIASIGGGFRYWVESTKTGPEGLAFRLQFTLLFPK
jgi:hypothetical protein